MAKNLEEYMNRRNISLFLGFYRTETDWQKKLNQTYYNGKNLEKYMKSSIISFLRFYSLIFTLMKVIYISYALKICSIKQRWKQPVYHLSNNGKQ